MQRTALAATVVSAAQAALLLLGGAQPAWAVDNTAPSRAEPVSVGVPFKAVTPNSGPDLWRLNHVVAPGERLQIAVDNTQGSERLTVCVIGPTDDFGYDSEVNAACGGDSTALGVVREGRSARLTLTYQRAAGQPILRFSSYFDRVTAYNATVEAVLPPVPPVPPDSDNDGVPDAVDACPDLSGPPTTGCPDRDADGVPDSTDQCVSTPGPPSAAGCPDEDGDGVPSASDRCPTVPGPGPTGCPPPPPKCKVERSKIRRGHSLPITCTRLASGTRMEIRWYRVTSRSKHATRQRSVYVTLRSGRARVPSTRRPRGEYRVSLWHAGSKLTSRSIRVR